jgi:hypothetical protein
MSSRASSTFSQPRTKSFRIEALFPDPAERKVFAGFGIAESARREAVVYAKVLTGKSLT